MNRIDDMQVATWWEDLARCNRDAAACATFATDSVIAQVFSDAASSADAVASGLRALDAGQGVDLHKTTQPREG